MTHREWTIEDYWRMTFCASLQLLVDEFGLALQTIRNKRSRWLKRRPGGSRPLYLADGEITPHMLDMVSSARYEILLCIPFVRAGREILDALVDAANRGVKVRIILLAEKGARTPLVHKLDHRIIHMMHSDRSHAKLLVTDQTALVTSLNLTDLSLHDNYESCSFMVDLQEVFRARTHFYRIYHDRPRITAPRGAGSDWSCPPWNITSDPVSLT